jgi:polysaccharide export outer membrane protein
MPSKSLSQFQRRSSVFDGCSAEAADRGKSGETMRISHIALAIAALLSTINVVPPLKAADEAQAEAAETSAIQQAAVENHNLASYVLGVGDQISVWALSAEEISDKPIPIGPSGYVNFPLVGRVRVTGLTVENLEAELNTKLSVYIKDPQVTVTVTQYSSKPVSLIGAVKSPGVHQIQRPLTLVETLSLAGGLAANAGPKVKITRRQEWGPLPLPGAQSDSSGGFSVAELYLSEILEASNPEKNILVQPHDVITVPSADSIYIIGAVNKPGAFLLADRDNVSVLTALSMAGGIDNRTASPKNARVLRQVPDQSERVEIAVNVQDILRGKSSDQLLEADDILFVPDSTGKKITARIIETAIRMGTYAARF